MQTPRSFLLQPSPIDGGQDGRFQPECFASVRVQIDVTTRGNIADVAVDVFLSKENANHSKWTETRNCCGKRTTRPSAGNGGMSPRTDTVVTNRESFLSGFSVSLRSIESKEIRNVSKRGRFSTGHLPALARARRARAACFLSVARSAFVIFPALTRLMSKDILLRDMAFFLTYIV